MTAAPTSPGAEAAFSLRRLGVVDPALVDWRSLYARSSRASFFLTPHWISAWAAGLPASADLFEARAEAGGETFLLGLFGRPKGAVPPLVGTRRTHLHEFGVDRLDTIYIEDNDFLLATNAPAELRETAVRKLIDATGAEEIVLRNCVPALAEAAVRAASAAGWTARELRRQPAFAVDLATLRTEGKSYLESRSKSLRAKLDRSRRRYEERGPITLKIAATDEERSQAWRTLGALHQQGWRRRGEAGAFSNPDFIAFHERLQALAPDATQLIELRVGGSAIGCLYNFIHGARALNYQSGFRYEDDNQLAPGLLTHAAAAQHYLASGFDAYDLLAGEADYKRRLGEERGVLVTLVLEKRAGPRARLRRVLKQLARAARRREETHQT